MNFYGSHFTFFFLNSNLYSCLNIICVNSKHALANTSTCLNIGRMPAFMSSRILTSEKCFQAVFGMAYT